MKETSTKLAGLSPERLTRLVYDQFRVVEQAWANQAKRQRELQRLTTLLEQVVSFQRPELERLAALRPRLVPDLTEETFWTLLVPVERLMQRLSPRDADFLPREEDRPRTGALKMPLIVVLDNLRSAFNCGAIFRTAECFALQEIYLCGYTATPESEKLRQAAMGCETLVPWRHFSHLDQALAHLREQKIPTIALETVASAPTIHETAFPFPSALILGNERFGLASPVLETVDHIIQIPMVGQKNSLNVANAFAIAASHARHQWNEKS